MKKKGFTLAEILITLTIIGVVAAITIPSLMANTDERVLNAKRKALHARMTQAISQLSIRDYEVVNDDGSDKNSALNFVTSGLTKVYKIAGVCDPDNPKACDFPSSVYRTNGSSGAPIAATFAEYSQAMKTTVIGGVDRKPVIFRTQNGESILLYYNPLCTDMPTITGSFGYVAKSVCVNMIYDLNGAKEGPNKVGTDIGFITVFNPTSQNIVNPVPDTANLAAGYTLAQETGLTHIAFLEKFINDALMPAAYADGTAAMTAAEGCAARGNYMLPSKEEAASLALNQRLVPMSTAADANATLFTSSVINNADNPDNKYIAVYTTNREHLQFHPHPAERESSTGSGYLVRCIKNWN